MTDKQEEVKAPLMITMENGEVKNFGERGKLLSSQVIDEQGIEITFHIVTGEQVVFTHNVEGLDELTAEAAAFGFASKIKASTAGVAVENLKALIEAKVEELNNGIWTSRNASGEQISPLSQIQTAYAAVNGIDVSGSEGISKVNAIFSAFSKEEKSALYKDGSIKLELAKLKLAAAQAALGL